MENQPVINIGMVGHVANGKSSIVKEVTGIATQRYSSEKRKNITIKLGYANAKIYKCPSCESPKCYQSAHSEEYSKCCDHCNANMTLVTHVSFIDCPGHIKFMSTMISGKCVMDTTIVVEAINHIHLPAPQTLEHLNAITMGGIPASIICLNKCDLVNKATAITNVEKLKSAFDSTILKNIPMVPISATFGINTDILCELIAKIPIPKRDLTSDIKMIIIRSFNINRPGIDISELKGGVVGGSIIKGTLKIGDKVKLLPGFIKKSEKKKVRYTYTPLIATILSIFSQDNELQSAITGGLIGVQLDIDPTLTTNDGMAGNILTLDTNMETDVFEELAINYNTVDIDKSLSVDDKIEININANNTEGVVTKLIPEEKAIIIKLDNPVAASVNDIVTICNDSRIFGSGKILEGKKCMIVL